MKVQDLILELEKLDPDLSVGIEWPRAGWREVTIAKRDRTSMIPPYNRFVDVITIDTENDNG